MRRAPPIDVMLPGMRQEHLLVRGLLACAAASLGAWMGGWMEVWRVGSVSGVAVLAWAVLAGALAGFGWPRASAQWPARLSFDGQHWSLLRAPGDAAAPGSLQVMLDLGNWMLLRHRALAAPQRGTWLALRAAHAPGQWASLRAVLFHGPRGSAADPLQP